MKQDSEYIKARRTDIKAQRHNARVFHRRLVAMPWQALIIAVLMCILSVSSIFNFGNFPQWQRHPWMGWVFGAFTLLLACYFLVSAISGWINPKREPEDKE